MGAPVESIHLELQRAMLKIHTALLTACIALLFVACDSKRPNPPRPTPVVVSCNLGGFVLPSGQIVRPVFNGSPIAAGPFTAEHLALAHIEANGAPSAFAAWQQVGVVDCYWVLPADQASWKSSAP